MKIGEAPDVRTKGVITGAERIPVSRADGSPWSISIDDIMALFDAPRDGKKYYRRDGVWEELIIT
jgi:hypothetical protein